MTSTTIQPEANVQELHRRGCLFYVKRGLKWLGIVLIALVLLGVTYQTIATEIDRRTFSPRGHLYTVSGQQMHINCIGEGSPALILHAGGGAESSYWHWVQNQMKAHTLVCAYDRAGLGWSEAVSTPRDPVSIVGELHMLLEEAGVHPPYLMAGHSYGAILARVYAAKYPQEVTGLALVDSLTVGFVEQSEIDQSTPVFYAAYIPLWLIQRLGVSRFILPREFQAMGYPPEIIPDMVALHAQNQTLDTDLAEKGLPGYMALVHASLAAEDLGDLPLAVLWASESYANYDMDSMLDVASFSSNSVTRVVEDSNHGSILGNEQHAQQVSDAILAVMEAAQTGVSLAQ